MMSLAQVLLSGLTVRGVYPGMNGREPRARRKGGFICPPVAVETEVRKHISGENMTPGVGLPTGFRTRSALRRENDAGTGVLDGISYEMRPPERK